MNISEFVEYVKTHIKEYLPEEYSEAEVTVNPVEKLDERYLGMVVKTTNQVSAPIIPVEKFYEEYKRTDDLELVMEEVAAVAQIEPSVDESRLTFDTYEDIKNQLFMRLSPVETNEAIMKESPHQVIGDLLITYHVLIDNDGGRWLSTRISNEMLNHFDVPEETLKKDAALSTSRLFPSKLESLLEAVTGEREEDPKMMVISNEDLAFGASALFTPGMMEKVATTLKGNYYVIPSSVHEFIAVSDSGELSSNDLKEMLEYANQTVVEPEDILSYQIYHYDSLAKEFNVAA